jgi:hypothetical protein
MEKKKPNNLKLFSKNIVPFFAFRQEHIVSRVCSHSPPIRFDSFENDPKKRKKSKLIIITHHHHQRQTDHYEGQVSTTVHSRRHLHLLTNIPIFVETTTTTATIHCCNSFTT